MDSCAEPTAGCGRPPDRPARPDRPRRCETPRPGARGAGAGLLALVIALAGCAGAPPTPPSPAPRPADVRATVATLLPPTVRDAPGWAVDITAAFAALRIDPSVQNLCSVIAVVEQESGFSANPVVPGLGRIARQEIERRADAAGVPSLLLAGALKLPSPDGRAWGERIDAARTEKELSDLFEELVDVVPLGRRWLAGRNPVTTAGPMQVRIDFAERHAEDDAYPYPVPGTLRDEVFTRRGGLYFGIAHLLDYRADYPAPIYRFADFNAGRWASRNAAFQQAVSRVTGIPLDLDGDLILPGSDRPGATEAAVRALGPRIGQSDGAIRRALEKGLDEDFDRTAVWQRVFELAERTEGRAQPRAVIPTIRLESPKITRRLTTEWFARRVDERHRRCTARAAGAAAR